MPASFGGRAKQQRAPANGENRDKAHNTAEDSHDAPHMQGVDYTTPRLES
jgi:hypothetical protein